MALGSWKAPFPLRFGGGTRKVIDAFYKQLQASRPDVLRGGEGTHVDVENKALARLLETGWRATQRRVAQRDPMKLSALQRPVTFPDGTVESLSMLERWERILLLTPRPEAGERERRAAVKARLVGQTSTNRQAVTDAMTAIFGSWFVEIVENDVDEVDYAGRATPGTVRAHWGDSGTTFSIDYPGEYDANWPWRTGLAVIAVVIEPPAATPREDIDAKKGQARATLDEMLPAWMVATVSEIAPDATGSGFFLDISPLDITAL
jgi:hypothetical protein